MTYTDFEEITGINGYEFEKETGIQVNGLTVHQVLEEISYRFKKRLES